MKIFLSVILCIITVLLLFGILTEKKDSLKMLVIDENYSLFTVDFFTGTVIKMETDISEYCDEEKKSLLFTEKQNDLYKVLLFSGNGKQVLFETTIEIVKRPIKVNELIYFIGVEKKEDSTEVDVTYRYNNCFLYCYDGSEVHKVINDTVDVSSQLLSGDNTVLFVEKESNIYTITILNVVTGEIKELCKGKNPCWVEPGKTFLCELFTELPERDNIYNKKIAIVNVEKLEIVSLDEYFIYSDMYTIKNDKMFCWGPDRGLEGGYIPKIIDLKSMQEKSVRGYQSIIKRLFSKRSIDSVFYDCIYCEWL